MSYVSLSLQFETIRFEELKRRILAIEPDLDERTLQDSLEGCTSLKELIIETVRSAIEDAMMVQAIKERIDDLKERAARYEGRHAEKREVVQAAMEQSGMAKLVEPDCTVSLRTSPPSLSVTDEQAIPEWFWVPQAAKLDKLALLNALKAGATITGAELSATRQVLSIRTR